MSGAVQKERVEQVRSIVHEVLGGRVSNVFLGRIDAVLGEWSEGRLNAAQACDKVQKVVALFVGEKEGEEISNRCALIVMRETASKK